MINVIVNAADARKATSISAFRISSITEITTFMVIVEGSTLNMFSRYLHKTPLFISSLTETLIISMHHSSHTSGNSRPQNQAIALAVEEAVLVDFQDQPSKQGSAVSGWILLDYGKLSIYQSPCLSIYLTLSPCSPTMLLLALVIFQILYVSLSIILSLSRNILHNLPPLSLPTSIYFLLNHGML